MGRSGKTVHDPTAPAPPSSMAPDFRESDTEGSITARLDLVTRALGDRLAVRTLSQSLTFSELVRRSRVVAAAVSDHNGGARSVAIFCSLDEHILPAIYGSLRADTVHTIIDPAYPGERARFVLEDCEADLVLTDSTTEPHAKSVCPESLPRIVVDELDSVADDRQFAPSAPGDLACLTYTSGSTGRPKAVMQSHRNILRRARQYGAGSHITPVDKAALLYSPGFSAATGQIHGTLLSGGALYPFPLRDHSFRTLAEWIDREEITILRLVTSLFRHLATSLDPSVRFPSVRSVGLGGEAVTSRDVKLFASRFSPAVELRVSYASTEAAMIAVQRIDGSLLPSDPIPAGRPVEGVEIRIVDEAGRRLPDGSAGEIVVVSNLLPEGYWRNPNLTEEKYGHADDGRRSFRTGDRGRLLPDGSVILLGRLDQQIKIRGHRVEPGEIERVLGEDPFVRQAAVVGRPGATGDMVLVAFVVPAGPQLDRRACRAGLARRLPAHMVPSIVVAVDELPLNANGKVDRRALAEIEIETPAAQDDAPGDQTEERLRIIWMRILERERIALSDDFFEIGGDSLLAARVFAEIEREFGVSLPLAILLEEPTLAGQARAIRETTGRGFGVLVPLRAAGTRPILFLVAPMGGNVLCYRDIAASLGDGQAIWGLQAHGLDGSADVPTTVEAMAASYVEAIRSLQPAGPYYLGGHSIGGTIAFEMARQLEARGEEVALTALLDANGLSRRVSLIRRGAVRLRLIARNPLRRTLQFAREYGRRGRRWIDMHRLMIARHPGEDLGEPLRVVAAIRTAAFRKYSPGPYQGSVLLIRAEWGMKTILSNEDFGWSRVVSGGIEIHDVPGDHFDFLRGALAPNVAAVLRAAIDRTIRVRREA